MRYLETTEAAALLDVSPSTLRAWEHRFGFPQPHCSFGGHRSYTHGEVVAVREALQQGLSISAAVRCARAAVAVQPGRKDRDRGRNMAVSLLEVEPDLAHLLTAEQRVAAEEFAVPEATVGPGGDIEALLVDRGAFAALVLEGLIVHAVQIGEHETLTLLGPGSVVPPVCAPPSMPFARSRLVPTVRSRLVMLDERFLLAAHRWPPLVVCLHRRMLEQATGLTMQNAISQLPRVEDRLLALMRLLAESWGHVTPAGIRLTLSISHETLGGLVGARRPTVTLALRTLAEQGSLIKQGHGWLIQDEQREQSAGREMHRPRVALEDLSSLKRTAPPAPRPDVMRSRLRSEALALIREQSTYHRERAWQARGRAVALRAQSQRLQAESTAKRVAGGSGSTRNSRAMVPPPANAEGVGVSVDPTIAIAG